MAKFEMKQNYPGRSASECYQAGLRMVNAAGYTIFKKRDIASLAICQGTLQGDPIELSLVVPLGHPTSMVLNLSSDRGDEPGLNSEAVRLFSLLETELKKSR